MSIGLDGDTRQFQRKPRYRRERDYKDVRTKPLRCAICKQPIVGKRWRIDEGVWACTRCNNEKPV